MLAGTGAPSARDGTQWTWKFCFPLRLDPLPGQNPNGLTWDLLVPFVGMGLDHPIALLSWTPSLQRLGTAIMVLSWFFVGGTQSPISLAAHKPRLLQTADL